MSEEPIKVIFTRYGPGKPPPPPMQTAILSLNHGPLSPEDLERASLLTKAVRLKSEMRTWLKGGAKLVRSEVRKARLAVCKACEYFDPKGNWGLGQCMAPGCGCSKIKAALAGMKCPKGKWPA